MENKLSLPDLIIYGSLMSPTELNQNLTLANFMGLPLSTVLAQQGLLDRRVLRILEMFVDLVNEKTLSPMLAKLSINELKEGRSNPEELLAALSEFAGKARCCRLGEFLVDADLLNEVSLGQALFTCKHSGQLLGAALLSRRLLSAAVLNEALRLQEVVRFSGLDYQVAVERLKNFVGFNSLPATA